MPANGRASRGDGKCNREETADGPARGTGKGETVVQETTASLATADGMANPTRSKAKQGRGAARANDRKVESPG